MQPAFKDSQLSRWTSKQESPVPATDSCGTRPGVKENMMPETSSGMRIGRDGKLGTK